MTYAEKIQKVETLRAKLIEMHRELASMRPWIEQPDISVVNNKCIEARRTWAGIVEIAYADFMDKAATVDDLTNLSGGKLYFPRDAGEADIAVEGIVCSLKFESGHSNERVRLATAMDAALRGEFKPAEEFNDALNEAQWRAQDNGTL